MKAVVAVLTAILLLFVGLMVPAAAEVVGKLTQVEGKVDFLKGGKLPATAAKLEDGVEVGDVLRTKSLSKAQITFMDNTVITVSPESRIAIEEYMFSPGQGKRNAVVQLFQGLAHVVVSKLFKVSEPDFVVKSHTAVMGVRGTEFGIRLHPNSSTILNFEGHTEVGNIFPEVGDLLFKKAYKIAFSWGGASTVHLHNMQGTTVFRGLPPTQPFTISSGDRQQFMGQMGSGLTSRRSTGGGTQTAGGGTSGSGSSSSSSSGSSSSSSSGDSTGGGGGSSADGSTFTSASLGGPDSGLGGTADAGTGTTTTVANLTSSGTITPQTTGLNQGLNPIITPTLPTTPTDNPPPTPPAPTPSTYTLSATSYTKFDFTSATGGQSGTTNSTGWAQATGGWSSTPLYYTSSSTGSRTLSQGALLPASSAGTSTGTLSGTVTGILGSSLTGTGTYSGTSSYGETLNFTGTIVVDSSGQLTFAYGTGTNSSNARLLSASGTITYTPGTYFTQTTDGAVLRTSTSPFNSASSTTTGTGLWAGGSRTGVLPGSFNLAMTATETSPWRYWYQPNELGDMAATMQGVVSPTTGGAYQGAMTINPANPDTPFPSSLLPQFQPSPYQFLGAYGVNTPIVSSVNMQSNGAASGTMYATDFQDGRFASSIYNLSQMPQTAAPTPVSATYRFTEDYHGAYMLNNNGAVANNANGFGWGQRIFSGTDSTAGTSVYNGFFASNDNGSWTVSGGSGTLPMYYGSSLTPGTGPGTAQITGLVSGILGHTLSGSMTYIGSLLNGASFSYSGPATISNDGYLTFNYQNGSGYTSTWLYPGGASGTATGTMWQSPGYHFTQTMTGDSFNITGGSNNWNISLSNSNPSAGGSRSGVYGGSIGTFNGALALYTPTASTFSGFSGSGTGSVSVDLEGVASYTNLGAVSGAATANITLTNFPNQLSLASVPGIVNLTGGGSFFSPAPVYVTNNTGSALQVVQNMGSGASFLTQTPTWNFTESYQGFRISTTSFSANLANIEGYGWTKFTSSTLPSGSYLGTGYGLIQNLGTIASASPLASSILGVNGTINAILSGAAGQTLTGQATFAGTNSSGINFTYQGQVSLSPTGQLFFNYGGNWNAPSGQNGTASGMIQQVPGTYFTETLTGNYQQVATTGTSGTPNFMATTGTLNGTGKTASFASQQSSTVTPFTPASGSITMNVEGVVAGADWQSKWGVASTTPSFTPSGGSATTIRPTTTGPVTIDTAGTLTTQSVGTIANGMSGPPNYTPLPPDTISRNLISVTTASGLTTAAYAQTATGTINQTVTTTDGSGMTITTPTPLTGANIGALAGNTSANLAITSSALQPGSYVSGTGLPATVNSVGVVAGPAGGTMTGVSTVQAVQTVGATTTTPVYVGSTILTPAAGSTPAALTTILSGVNSVPLVSTGVGATQTGTLTVTPR